jgi:hypothetical protein
MTLNCRPTTLAACTAILISRRSRMLQTPTGLKQAELAGLSPQLRAEEVI